MAARLAAITVVPGTAPACTTRHGEVAAGERGRDVAEVRADRRHGGRVVAVARERDAAAVGERVEAVRRRVLVDAHRGLAALLQRGERGVGGAVVGRVVLGAERRRGEEEEQE